MVDVLVIGGGVIGLSIAYELSRYGTRVQVIDRGLLGKEASWAGAGILPPATAEVGAHPYDQLRALSFDLHPVWSERLREETGIDNGFRRCGGLYLATSVGESAALRGFRNQLVAEGIAIEPLDNRALAELEPALADAAQSGRIKAAWLLPAESQLRNPRHLQALVAACRLHGVDLVPNVAAEEFVVGGNRLEGIKTAGGVLRAERYCITSGAWTERLLAGLGVATGILPIRGQMVLFACDQPPFSRVLNEGNRYLVPRDDGRVLAGSTEEEVGFDKRTTDVAIAELTALARGLVPALVSARLEKTWAGLRPATFDGFPYLGRVPGLDNAFVAAGHFRSGLFLSPGTAMLMADLVRGQTPAINLGPFRVGRG
jgi:glycine oxidase